MRRTLTETTFSCLDYRDVEVDGLAYCDIPYKGATGYGEQFDHKAFWSWAEACSVRVAVSARDAPSGWEPVLTYWAPQYLGGHRKAVAEHLFVRCPG